MTREEAIKRFETLLLHVDTDCVMGMETTEAINMAISALKAQMDGDVVSRNAIIKKLNAMDRYKVNELVLCDTDEKFPKNEVFIIDDVYEGIVEQLPSAQPENIIQQFRDYQVEWLTSHCDLELEPTLEEWIVRFLNDTAECFELEGRING